MKCVAQLNDGGHHRAMTQRAEDGILRLEALIYDDLYRFVDPASRVAQVGWGMFFTVAHQVRAVLTLHREGVCFGAAPIRRTVFEYTLGLTWLADDGESVVDILNRTLQNGHKLLSTRLNKDSLADRFPSEMLEQLAETVAEPLSSHPDERLMKPWHLIEEYDPTLKSYYATESGFSHLSLISVQHFVKFQNDATVLSQMPIPEEAVPCVEFCLHAFFQCFLSFDSILTGRPWTSALSEIAADYGLSMVRRSRRSTPSSDQ